jgi:hypothetical protein
LSERSERARKKYVSRKDRKEKIQGFKKVQTGFLGVLCGLSESH